MRPQQAARAAAFIVSTTSVSADKPFIHDSGLYNGGFLGQFPSQKFHSSNVVAPLFQVNTLEPDLVDDSGYLFLALEYDGKGGPAIFSSKDLSLVYADLKYEQTFDARAQDRQGFEYLTFIEGGSCHVFDTSYQKKWTVTSSDFAGTQADIHEFQFTNQGTAIISIYQDVRNNLTVFGGAVDGWLSDSLFQEVDLETNRVINVWRASNHFDLNDTLVEYNPKTNFMGGEGFDWFHLDSVYKSMDGHYLVSSKALSSIALLRAENLDPRWVLGGKRNQFKDLSGGNATNFAHQYNARFVQGNESRLSFFDNQVPETGTCAQGSCSRGVVVELDYEKMTAEVLYEFYHPQGISSGSGGSVQGLDNNNFLVGWGSNPAITEHLPNGTIAMDIQRGVVPHESDGNPDTDMAVYRAWKMAWNGRPLWGPSIASLAPGNVTTNATIYVSWNGDTEYAGEDEKNVTTSRRLIGNSTRTGFETEIHLEGQSYPKFARAAALDKDGEVIGLTATVDIASGQIHGNSSSVWIARGDGSDDDVVNGQGGEDEVDEEDSAFLTRPSASSVFALVVQNMNAALSLRQTAFVCRRCLQASRQARAFPVACFSSQADKPQDGAEKEDKTVTSVEIKIKDSAATKEPGPMARRLEEATEEALFTGGRAGRRAVEDAGFSEELKEKLLNKIADANFKSEHAGAFAEAGMSSSAGEGTRHIASAQAWTGEESTADTVLRMLDDAKKPLAPGLRGKYQPPPVDMRLQRQPTRSPGQKVATARDRATTYVGMGAKDKSKNGLSEDEKEAWRKELRERFEPGARALPNTISGLAALANERIENAIARGQFKNIPRGKGIERDARADNPFIDTTEYIMNKMIQRQDIVPPWIEKQQELSKAAGAFRARLRNDWRRHAARMIAARGGSLQEQMRRAEEYAAAEEVHNPIVRKKADGEEEQEAKAASPVVGRPFRDSSWEQAEQAYHKLTIEHLNKLARGYNLMAPDLAKKPYFSLERELKACYAEVAPTVAREIQDRATGGPVRTLGGGVSKKAKQTGLLESLAGNGDNVRIHVEAEEKAYGLKEWWRDVWKKN
ncbi:hypothetical protein FALBO_8342 [Fusarium albosuccineum]|uniref:DnaJ homologue subfamily C member 28 conserved domain-containing protein n=1 Tax=Fusarium albosuccineum TaxID=1237068 RepID=A0A8H4L8E8_9HYPO|nr:hypothetical protein FALBO_8342 [Fusarium albosuccineum]